MPGYYFEFVMSLVSGLIMIHVCMQLYLFIYLSPANFLLHEQEDRNLYGHHPFYLCVEKDGNAHGLFLLNSNAMGKYIKVHF